MNLTERTQIVSLLVLGLAAPLAANAQFNYVTNDNAITITTYNGLGGDVTIPSSINGLPVTMIGTAAFEYITNVTSVTIPGSVTSIGFVAFAYCTGLTNVTISNGVTSIGMSAFFGCTGMTTILIPNSLTNIGPGAFNSCSGLRSVSIGSGVTSIEEAAFINCSGLTSITIPGRVMNIGDSAFAYCSGLTSVTIPDSVTNIGGGVFAYCSGLTNVTIGSGLSSIEQGAFGYCTSMLSITVPNGITNIGSSAFAYCSSLTNVTIGNGVSSIGIQAFESCISLASVTIGSGVTSIGQQAFHGCTSLTAAYFQGNAPSSVGSGIFQGDPTTVYRYQAATGWGPTFGNAPVVVLGPLSTAPTVTTEPQDELVNAGDTVSFNITATGTLPLLYQWSLNGTNINGATTSTLTISKVTQSDLGTYVVVVTNDFGITNSSSAVLSMYPFLYVPFAGGIAYWGKPTALSVQAWGTGPLSYQWFKDGSVILDGTNSVLSFTSIQFTNAGLYSVVVRNSFGSVTNTPEQVVVNPAGVSLGLYPGVMINGVVGYNYIIRRTADLSNTNAWITMTTLTLAQPVQLWMDTNVDASLPTNPHHFYQVLPGQ